MTGTEGGIRLRKTSDGTLNRMKTFNQFLSRPNQFLSRSNQFLSRSSRFLSGQSDTEGESDNDGDSNLLASQTFPHCCSAMQLSSCRAEGPSRRSSQCEGSGRRSSNSSEVLDTLTRSMDRVKIKCRNLRESEERKRATAVRPKKKKKERRNLGSFPVVSSKSNSYSRLWNGSQDNTEDEAAKDGEEVNNKKMMNYAMSRNNSLSSQERTSPVFFLVVEDPDGVAVTDERDLPMERLSVPGSDSDGNSAPADRKRSPMEHNAPLTQQKPPLMDPTRPKLDNRLSKINKEGLYLTDCMSQPDLSVKRKGLFVAHGSSGGSSGANGGITTGRVGAWATDFDKLLRDPAGLQTFAEFLKKEFSHENIYFWCACEKYGRTQDGADRMKVANAIMERHLDAGAVEPVNIDSAARSTTRDTLANATQLNPPDALLFTAAQKQIYNLMKFDSFPRFLKSDVYKECMLADLAAKPLPYNGLSGRDEQLIMSPQETKTGFLGQLAPQEEGKSRRKSLLQSLVRVKRNRSKSKERPETPESKLSTGFFRPKKPSQLLASPLSSRKVDNNRLSLTTEELMKLGEGEVLEEDEKDACVLARVTLPDRATTVINTKTGENIRQLINRLLEKRGLVYPCFDVLMAGKEKPLDLSDDCSVLGCSELRVEPRILFRLELPSGKSIGVKSKPDKMIEEVVSPILQQYGWSLDNVIITINANHAQDGLAKEVKEFKEVKEVKEVNLSNNIAALDNKTVTVLQKSTSDSS